MLLKDLKLSPMRTFLTGLSMSIGIIAIILSVLVGTIGKSYMVGTTEQLGGRAPTYRISIQSAAFTSPQMFEKLLKRLTVHQADIALLVPNDPDLTFSTSSSPILTPEEKRQLLGSLRSVEVVYTTANYNRVFRLPLLSGQWLQEETDYPRLEAVVNQQAAEAFPLGHYIHVGTRNSLDLTPIPVIGVVNDGRSEPSLYLNVAGLSALAPHLLSAQSGSVLWHENGILTSDQEKISFVSDSLSDTTGGTVTDIGRADSSEVYEGALSALQLAFLTTAILLLLVSVLGLINIGLSTLEQRSHELLIRRALGASRASVAWLVLGSSILLAVFVSIVAIIISVAIVASVPLFLPVGSPVDPPHYPYSATTYAVSAAAITAILGSILPAIKASRLEPALALR
ncbi:hypothetical protein BM477_01295 [Boudabousia marimammalium]|uniref:ABC3 transporter permease protein domain-containing protein n=2 Tax=Boudabousia marimammalium TaxID=156892 RepID=A0A1Q5PSW4_9ACTO|nr:hypothetical protein BM477_01295 [Boudabousia marimammalium]